LSYSNSKRVEKVRGDEMAMLKFVLHLPTKAICSDDYLDELGDIALQEGYESGLFAIIELSADAASEFPILGLEDE
jgi:hypothetical protein